MTRQEDRRARFYERMEAAAASNDGAADDAAQSEMPLFTIVPTADLAHAQPPAPEYWWANYLPAGVVTLLGAHGGAGKSTIALMLAVCVSQGLPLFGIPTKRGRVAFFSAEDPASLVRYRLHTICRFLHVDPAALDGWLHALDATAGEPTLFHEVNHKGSKQGQTTPTYAALRDYFDRHHIDVLLVDNASDAFDASEIDRSRVRGFVRALARAAQTRAGAVLLLAHVDKGTSRGERAGTESYSGSTAWHNSVRSRLYLSRDKDGTLLLEHQKHNLGKLCEPLSLRWPEGGLPLVDLPTQPFVQHIADSVNTKALLKLIHEFSERGEHVGTATTSRTHAGKLLRGQQGFPTKLRDPELFDLLRLAERRGLLVRALVRSQGRGHEKEVWTVTQSGADLAGIIFPAPTAPTAPTSEVGAACAEGAEACADCADLGAGGVGGMARAQMAGAVGATADLDAEPPTPAP